MNFVSFSFAALFVVVLLGRLTVGRTKSGAPFLALLVAASLTFYAWHVPVYLLILLTSTCVDYAAGRYLGRAGGAPAVRRAVLVLSLAVNLGFLGVFKYADFFLEQLTTLAGAAGFQVTVRPLGWVLPMGISFYTFQSMSYTIDVYRGVLPSFHGFWKFLLYVSLFPQLMAGPIVRAKEFLYQIDRRRSLRSPVLFEGVYLLIQGYFLKMVVADHLGAVVDRHWDTAAAPGGGAALALGVALLFSFQIFCDFAGYTNIARGCGYLLGFRLPLNFNSPFIATSFSDFWRRWHISLSAWLRDYLYVSLGGNRKGRWRTLVNLMIVMVIGGLWHGAANTFLMWGAVHGTALVVERIAGLDRRSHTRSRVLAFGWTMVVQLTVVLTWILFRATDMEQALAILQNATTLNLTLPQRFPLGAALVVSFPVVLIHLRTLLQERFSVPGPGPLERAVLAGVMLYLTFTCYGINDAFIYFQF